MRILVLGGGPGGYSAAFEAARLGAEVTLVESSRLGGTCLNKGCIPTKAILRSARVLADARDAERFGLRACAPEVDAAALRSRTQGVVEELLSQVEARARSLKIDLVTGRGRLVGPHAVEAVLPHGETRVFEGDAVILATGSLPVRLPNIDHNLPDVWTSDDALELQGIPKKIVIIGGGAIGLEFACAYAAFGSEVTVVELMQQVLPSTDRRVARQLRAALEDRGVSFRLGDAVEAVGRGAGKMLCTLASGEALECDVVMSAVGRVPNTSGLGFEEAGIALDGRAVEVDEHFRTSVEGVYAAGDVIGGMMLAHVAEEEGMIAARNAVRQAASRGLGVEQLESVRYDCIPSCVYTFPEAATVGLTRDDASKQGMDAVQAVARLAGNGKAQAEGEAAGFVQIVAEKSTGRILGCQILGPHAVEIVHEAAIAMRNGLGVAELAGSVRAHPTVSEAVRAASLDAAARCRC